METKKEDLEGVQKEFEKIVSAREEQAKELPQVKKDAKKMLWILVITIVIAVLMRNVLNLDSWWLVLISILNVISIMATAILMIIGLKWFYLKTIEKPAEQEAQKEKEDK